MIRKRLQIGPCHTVRPYINQGCGLVVAGPVAIVSTFVDVIDENPAASSIALLILNTGEH